MATIAISYRRADSDAITGRIFDRLVAHFGKSSVFRDIDNIPLGVDFRDHINKTLGESAIVLVVIGPKWLGSAAGRDRIGDETDPVRIEIEISLQRKRPLIPILVGRANMPKASHLPESIKDFAYRNGLRVDAGQDFDSHITRLIHALDQILENHGSPEGASASSGVESIAAARSEVRSGAERDPMDGGQPVDQLTDLDRLRRDALQAESKGDLETAEQQWWRVIAVSPVDPQAHEAVKKLAMKQVGASNSSSAAPGLTPSDIDAQPHTDARRSPPLMRRRTVLIGAGAAAAASAGAVGLVALVRRRAPDLASHTLRFDFATVDEKGRQKPLQSAAAAIFTEDLGAGVTIDMVAITGGSFTMGSPDGEPERRPNEAPQHRVVLAPFWISAAPITQAQWLAVVMAHPGRLEHALNPTPSFFRGIDLPVETINWYEAVEFCQRLAAITGRDYRLPSEAQWEYACRAGTTDPFNVGPTITTELANYCGAGGAVCGESSGHSVASKSYDGVEYGSGAYGQGPPGLFRATTTRAGAFPPNRFGLYDMHGNVWEFCLDMATTNYDDVPRDGSAYLAGPTGGNRILRGGSWSHNPAICRSAYRDSIQPDNPGWQGRIGIRLVCG